MDEAGPSRGTGRVRDKVKAYGGLHERGKTKRELLEAICGRYEDEQGAGSGGRASDEASRVPGRVGVKRGCVRK